MAIVWEGKRLRTRAAHFSIRSVRWGMESRGSFPAPVHSGSGLVPSVALLGSGREGGEGGVSASRNPCFCNTTHHSGSHSTGELMATLLPRGWEVQTHSAPHPHPSMDNTSCPTVHACHGGRSSLRAFIPNKLQQLLKLAALPTGWSFL